MDSKSSPSMISYTNPVALVTESSYNRVMTSQSDDLERLKRKPTGVRFSDLERIILRAGFTLDRVRGSHHVYVRGGRVLTIVKPHGKRKTCHPRDVRDAIRFLEDEG